MKTQKLLLLTLLMVIVPNIVKTTLADMYVRYPLATSAAILAFFVPTWFGYVLPKLHVATGNPVPNSFFLNDEKIQWLQSKNAGHLSVLSTLLGYKKIDRNAAIVTPGTSDHLLLKTMKNRPYVTSAVIAGLSYGAYKAYQKGCFSRMNPFGKDSNLEQDAQNSDDTKK